MHLVFNERTGAAAEMTVLKKGRNLLVKIHMRIDVCSSGDITVSELFQNLLRAYFV